MKLKVLTWSSAARVLLLGLLVFTPLARGAVQGWAETVICMVVVLCLGCLLAEKIVRWQWQWIATPLDIPFAALVALSLVASLFAVHAAATYWATTMLICYLVVFYLVIHLFPTRADRMLLVYTLVAVGSFLAVFGLFKRFGYNPFGFWNYGDLKSTSDFLSATFGNRNHLAGYLEMALALLLGLFWRGYTLGKRLLMIYLSLVMLAALTLSLSRGGWAGMLLGTAFMTAVFLIQSDAPARKLVGGLAAGTIFLALVVLSSTPVVERVQTVLERDEAASFVERVDAWSGVVEMIKAHPLTGTGPGTFATVFTQYQPPGLLSLFTMAHNDYLQFMAESGLLLIPIMIWMIVVLYRHGFNRLRHPSRMVRGVTLGAMGGISAILIHSFVDFNLHIPANALLFAVMSALVVAKTPKSRRRMWLDQVQQSDRGLTNI